MTEINTSLAGMAGILYGLVRSAPSMHEAALTQAGQIVQKAAKDVLGTYDYGWPSLAQSTIDRKGSDNPGIETGEMQDSIMLHVTPEAATIGSDLDRAVYFELGTRTQPPRSFLAESLIRHTDEVLEIIGPHVKAWLGSGGSWNFPKVVTTDVPLSGAPSTPWGGGLLR